MNLLEKCLELYKGVLEAKPRNDAMVLQLQQYIVNHFGHDGTRGMATIEEGPLEYKYKTPQSNARTLRAFEHPLNVNKGKTETVEVAMFDDPLTKLQAQYHDIGLLIKAGGLPEDVKKLVTRAASLKVQINALTPQVQQQPAQRLAGVGEKSDILTAKVASGKPNPLSPSPIPAPPDAAEGNTGTDGGQMPEMDVAHLLTLRGKALGEAYPPEVLKYWLKSMGVEMTGKESRTQLGNLVLQ